MPDLKRSPVIRSVLASDNGPSRALLAAQRRLEKLRAERQRPRRASVSIFQPAEYSRLSEPAGHSVPDRQQTAAVPLAVVVPESADDESVSKESGKSARPPSTVRLQPALALAILGAEQAAAGRIWLLLRALDEVGQGWLTTEHARERLTEKVSTSHVCGRRQLRNLLNQGEGIFWSRQRANNDGQDRIWLRSPGRVAIALGMKRLAGRPVEIPLAALLGGLGRVRAHFYATFHSGRHAGAPISRDQLAQLTHVPPRTQRLYDQAAGVNRMANYAVADEYTNENSHERAWQHGRATFKFIDHQGMQGQAGRSYVAWRLPNSYTNNDALSEKRKGNKKQPVDLVTIGAQGNDRKLIGRPRQPVTLFHPDGGAAGKAYNRDCSVDAYWPAPGVSSRRGSHLATIWLVIGRADSQWRGNFLPGL